MSAPVKITRTDHTAEQLHQFANKCKDARQARRLRAVANVIDGATRGKAARAAGTTPQTLRDWVIRYNEQGVDGLCDAPRSGRPSHLTQCQAAELKKLVLAGPDFDTDGVSRWRVSDLVKLVKERFGVSYSVDGLRKKLHALGLRWVTVRPVHPKANVERQREFRESFGKRVAERLPPAAVGLPLEIWFQDETRYGLIGVLARMWAAAKVRTAVMRDHRHGSSHLMGAACGSKGKAVGRVCKRCNTEEMNVHLGDISKAVSPGCHAVVVLDRASWHRAKALVVPDNMTLLHLPPYSPELNPMEQVWNYIKSNFLRNRVHPDVDEAQRALVEAWRIFADDPARIASIMARQWAKA